MRMAATLIIGGCSLGGARTQDHKLSDPILSVPGRLGFPEPHNPPTCNNLRQLSAPGFRDPYPGDSRQDEGDRGHRERRAEAVALRERPYRPWRNGAGDPPDVVGEALRGRANGRRVDL